MLTALTYLYTTEDDIEAMLSDAGLLSRRDDDGSGAVAAGTETNSLEYARNWATSTVNLYCLGLYAASDLALSFIVNQWCTALASCKLCKRRGNPCPTSIAEDCAEAMAMLKEIKAGTLTLPDTPMSGAGWLAWSNVRVDPRYRTKQVRVEKPISEDMATDYPQSVDQPSLYGVEG